MQLPALHLLSRLQYITRLTSTPLSRACWKSLYAQNCRATREPCSRHADTPRRQANWGRCVHVRVPIFPTVTNNVKEHCVASHTFSLIINHLNPNLCQPSPPRWGDTRLWRPLNRKFHFLLSVYKHLCHFLSKFDTECCGLAVELLTHRQWECDKLVFYCYVFHDVTSLGVKSIRWYSCKDTSAEWKWKACIPSPQDAISIFSTQLFSSSYRLLPKLCFPSFWGSSSSTKLFPPSLGGTVMNLLTHDVAHFSFRF